MKKKFLATGLTAVLLIALLAVFFPSFAPTQVEAATFLGATEAKITAADAAAGDNFGRSVANSGDTVVVGAPWNDDAGADSGSAYVFVRSGTSWSQQAKLTAADAAAYDYFGYSVAISGDTVVVGADRNDDAGTSSGSAYVFVRSGTSWSQQAKLTATDAAAYDYFGSSVAISGDTVVVGANGNSDAGANSGSAYVFVRSGTSWGQQAKLTAADADVSDNFGFSVAISSDTVVVGAFGNSDAGTMSGSAYVFVRSGTSWGQQAKLTAADAAAYNYFGFSVAISGDTVVVGADGNDDAGAASGSAYVFVRSGTSWSQQAKLTAADAAAYDNFGCSVAISGDTVVVGALGNSDAGADSGSAYVFVRSGTSWSQQAKLTAGDIAAGDYFGCYVAISGDTVVVGALGNDGYRGSAYVYEAVPTEYELLQAELDVIKANLDGLHNKVDALASKIDELDVIKANLDGLHNKVDALASKIDEIESVVKKLDLEVLLQLLDKRLTIYHIGTSFGGLPVEASLNSAQGIRWVEGQGLIYEDITADVMYSAAGPGHLQVEVNLPNADDYSMFQFVVEYDDGGTPIFGTLLVQNENYKAWAK